MTAGQRNAAKGRKPVAGAVSHTRIAAWLAKHVGEETFSARLRGDQLHFDTLSRRPCSPYLPLYVSLLVATASAEDGDNSILEAEDVIHFSVEVFNTGNTCLGSVVLFDLLGVVDCGDSGTGAPNLYDIYTMMTAGG